MAWNRKSKSKLWLYNLAWNPAIHPAQREIEMIRRGGEWIKPDGTKAGNGLPFHYRKFQEIIYGDRKIWHRWNLLQLECFLKYRTVGVIGPKSSGKTCAAASDCLADWYIWPECTTVLCTSTTRERLEDRVWGEIKKYHRIARARVPWLPGHLIEGRQRIVYDAKDECTEGRDMRNGLQGLACKRGNEMVNIADFAGIKNKRVRVVGDELSHFPKSFIDIISNLDANPDFIFYGLGNPKETTDALGFLCEPATILGGWEGGIDQKPGTKTWEIRRPQGICIQLPGDDSPNLDGKMSIPLITRAMMDRDEAFYGKDSWQYTMMNLGRMPRGQGSRRVLTRQMCMKFGAMREAIWKGNLRQRIAFLDAAYRGVGGDRCIFGVLEFGEEGVDYEDPEGGVIAPNKTGRQIISLMEISVVPIVAGSDELPEDQIVKYVKDKCQAMGIPPEDFWFDSGMRTSLVTAFSRLWSPNVESVDCGGRPTDQSVSGDIRTACHEYYSKFITELWYSVRLAVEASQVRGMTEEVMWEFCAREWRLTPGNKIEVEPKADMKIKTGRSPDLADGFSVGIFGARQRGFVISKLGTSLRSNSQEPNWRRRLKESATKLWRSGELQTA